MCSLITGYWPSPAFAAKLTVFNRHPLLNNPVTCLEIDQVGPWNTQPLSRHILTIDTFQIMFSVFPYIYIPTPLYCWVAIQATWRALCLGLRIRHDSRGVGKVLRSSKPLNSQGPCSLVIVSEARVASCFETRVSLRFLRSAYLRFLLRPELPPVQGPRAFGFRGPCTSA